MFEPLNYGNVLAKIEGVNSARLQNQDARQRLDPNSPQNQLLKLQLEAARQGVDPNSISNQMQAEQLRQLKLPQTVKPETIKGADGFNYWISGPEKGQRVIPGAELQPPKPTEKQRLYEWFQGLPPEEKAAYIQQQKDLKTPGVEVNLNQGLKPKSGFRWVDENDYSKGQIHIEGGPEDPEVLKKAADAKAETKQKVIDKANKISYQAYKAGMDGVTSALENTVTGPILGGGPAITPAQQTAEGALSAMAPILKQLFRTAGEGTFTDKDQDLLMGMLPKRTDHPEARKAKIANINAIVNAKLGIQATGMTDEDYNARKKAQGL